VVKDIDNDPLVYSIPTDHCLSRDYLDNVRLDKCSTNASLCQLILTVSPTDELSGQQAFNLSQAWKTVLLPIQRAWNAAIMRTDV